MGQAPAINSQGREVGVGASQPGLERPLSWTIWDTQFPFFRRLFLSPVSTYVARRPQDAYGCQKSYPQVMWYRADKFPEGGPSRRFGYHPNLLLSGWILTGANRPLQGSV